jgi:hypothetical protein
MLDALFCPLRKRGHAFGAYTLYRKLAATAPNAARRTGRDSGKVKEPNRSKSRRRVSIPDIPATQKRINAVLVYDCEFDHFERSYSPADLRRRIASISPIPWLRLYRVSRPKSGLVT